MTTAQRAPAIGLTTIPRAVLSVAAEVVHTVERVVIGDTRVRTARGNAYDAMCADRARAQARHETSRLVAALAASSAERVAAAELAALNARPAPYAQPSPTAQLTAAQVAVGSSPRSSASQATLVSTPV
jgi:hypothetical protein